MPTLQMTKAGDPAKKAPSGFRRLDDGTLVRVEAGEISRAHRERYGGGFRERTRSETKDGEVVTVTEVISLAAGGFVTNNTTPRGNDLEAAKEPTRDRKRILERCYNLYKTDPLGGQIAETTKNFLFGAGTKVAGRNDEEDRFLKRFRIKNDMGLREGQVGAMSVYQGDIYFWLRPVTEDLKIGQRVIWRKGDTRLTLIDPLNIAGIEHDPVDTEDVYFYHFEYRDVDTSKTQKLKIPDHTKYDPQSQKALGCIIHLKFNSDPNDSFGSPDYLRIGEWLENYAEYLRDGVIINRLYRSPCYDITITDGDATDIAAAAARYRNWKVGSNPVHNDKEVWSILEFTGPNSSQSEARRAILLIIAAGVGFAEYMLADGSNANLASTTTQELPVLKKFEARQLMFKWAFTHMYGIVLLNANAFAGLKLDTDDFGDLVMEVSVDFPALVRSEESAVEGVNTSAVEGGYMSRTTAAERLGLNLKQQLRERLLEAEEEIAVEKEILAKRVAAGLQTDPAENERADLDVKKAKAEKDRAAAQGASDPKGGDDRPVSKSKKPGE